MRQRTPKDNSNHPKLLALARSACPPPNSPPAPFPREEFSNIQPLTEPHDQRLSPRKANITSCLISSTKKCKRNYTLTFLVHMEGTGKDERISRKYE